MGVHHGHGAKKEHASFEGVPTSGLHDHIHSAQGQGSGKTLWIAAGATLAFAGVEAIAGRLGGSLALMSDAGHMATDSLALVLAAASAMLARSGPDARRTFGWAKAESVAGLFNAGLMIALIVWIAYQAIERMGEPAQAMDGAMVLAVGGAGLAMNIAVGWMLLKADRSLSVRAAMLHTASDALGSVAAMGAGLGYTLYGWTWVDPVLSIAIALLIGRAAWSLLVETFETLIDAAPIDVDVKKARGDVAAIEGVEEVLDFHIWRLAPGEPSLSAHLKIKRGTSCQPVIAEVERVVGERFGIRHCTIQPHEL